MGNGLTHWLTDLIPMVNICTSHRWLEINMIISILLYIFGISLKDLYKLQMVENKYLITSIVEKYFLLSHLCFSSERSLTARIMTSKTGILTLSDPLYLMIMNTTKLISKYILNINASLFCLEIRNSKHQYCAIELDMFESYWVLAHHFH